MPEPDDFPIVTEQSAARLPERNLVDYKDYRRQLIRWLLTFGKDPRKVEGYGPASVKNHAYRTDKFLQRFLDDLWERFDVFVDGFELVVGRAHFDLLRVLR